MTEEHDNLFAKSRAHTSGFRFDEQVVRVFPDMIARSVPGYELVVPMIGMLARRYAQPDSNIYDLELDFAYAFVLPSNVSWELDTTYNWNQDDGEVTQDLALESDFSVDLITPTWEFYFEQNASTTIFYDTNEPTFWDHDFTFGAIRELTPRIFFDIDYQYQYSGDAENSDGFETNLEWRGRNSSLAFKVTNERVFEGPKDVLRTYEAEFTLEF